MDETDGMTLVQTQVLAVTGFSPSNVSISKWGILNSGKAANYAIIKPGEVNRPQLTFTVKDNMVQTVVEVWQMYVDDGSSMTTLLNYVDAIKDRIDQYRKLADTTATVRDANVSRLGMVVEKWNAGGDGPSWLMREIYIDWVEEESITYAE